MNRRAIIGLIAGAVALTVTGYGVTHWTAGVSSGTESAGDGLDVTAVLGAQENLDGFARATRVRPFHFPDDHGPHRAYRSEWWYFTGNLATRDGRRIGYEISLFRFALSPHRVARPSSWATNQVYMGHFAITDTAKGRFHYFERLARGALGLAGAQADPLKVWVEGWSVRAERGADFPWHLHAADGGVQLALSVTPLKPIVLQGDRGLSQKSAAPGNASYYYSITRLDTRGVITIDGEPLAVTGWSWFDREWSTSALGADQAGWDWFGLHLTDGYDLLYYRLRREDGSIDPHSAGALVDPRGRAMRLGGDDVLLEPLGTWRSPRGGIYPARWRLRVKPAALDLIVTPVLSDQELALSVRYWEGAVDVAGRHRGETASGSGYAELTGYATGVRPAR